MKALRWFSSVINNIPLRTKLIILILIVIITTAGSITIFSYATTENALLKQSREYSEAYLNQISKRVDLVLENVHRGTMSVAFNKDFLKTVRLGVIDNYNDMAELFRNINLLSTLANSNRLIFSGSIYDLKRNVQYTFSGSRESIASNSPDLKLIQKLFIESGQRLLYKWVETREIIEYGSIYRVISFAMPVDYWGDANTNTVIVTNVKEDEIYKIYSEIDMPGRKTYLLDKENKIISTKDKSFIGKKLEDIPLLSAQKSSGSFINKMNKNKFLVTYVRSSYTGWTFVTEVNVGILLKENTDALQKTLLLICGITITFIFLISLFLNIQIYKPMAKLISRIRKDEEQLEPLYNSRKDEIGFLFQSFHDIIQDKKNLLKNVYDHKLLLKDAEIRLLHSQINSHFLYNTLDSVIWMAKAGDFSRIITIVEAMATFFRISLDKGNEVISVSRVKEQIESYFVIQKIRYSDRLQVKVDIDPEIYDCKMLKLLLQPVVENSIHHGIEKKLGEGLIRIIGRMEEGMLHFIVEDNGVGIPLKRLDEVNLIINSEKQDTKDFYALQNINNRIRLFYGEHYGIQIESHMGKGTKVSVKVPVIQEEVGKQDDEAVDCR